MAGVQAGGLGLRAGRPRRTGQDSALIWQYGPSAQLIVIGITAGDPQPDVRMGPLTWEELSHEVIVASHFSPVVGIYNLEGSVRRGFLPRLKALDWNQPVIISADQNRQVICFRARVQEALWTLPMRGFSCAVASLRGSRHHQRPHYGSKRPFYGSSHTPAKSIPSPTRCRTSLSHALGLVP